MPPATTPHSAYRPSKRQTPTRRPHRKKFERPVHNLPRLQRNTIETLQKHAPHPQVRFDPRTQPHMMVRKLLARQGHAQSPTKCLSSPHDPTRKIEMGPNPQRPRRRTEYSAACLFSAARGHQHAATRAPAILPISEARAGSAQADNTRGPRAPRPRLHTMPAPETAVCPGGVPRARTAALRVSGDTRGPAL
ncbi:hypothetical protein NDU88_002242 [Pleurodeles waltl]|uniref:Uncharacterized protein n=1 Tax=Pleurodeles waltl TaxID=8319 RepID=A0AAV7SAC8_PLEWA|nr:hypothetical protein NDU88_002242 [Pleurodeles waltl]